MDKPLPRIPQEGCQDSIAISNEVEPTPNQLCTMAPDSAFLAKQLQENEDWLMSSFEGTDEETKGLIMEKCNNERSVQDQ